MATFQFRVLRLTTRLLDVQTVTPSITPSVVKCPVHPAQVEIVLEGTGGLTGTVTVSGLVDGLPDTEVVTFTGPIANNRAVARTCKLFGCVTGFDTADLTTEAPPPTITARFCTSGGEGVHTVCELSECVFAHREMSAGHWPNNLAGNQEQARQGKIDMDDLYDFEPRLHDLFIEQRNGVDSTIWQVHGKPPYLGDGFSHHWEMDVQIRNAMDAVEIPA